MSYHSEDGIDEVMRRSAERRFDAWSEQLREGDPRFAEAAALHEDKAGWQSAVYLLTGCDVIWGQLGRRVLTDRSLDCVVRAIAQGDEWRSTQLGLMRWAAHFWDGEQNAAGAAAWTFEEFHFRRWVTATHLRRAMAPALTIIDERRR